MLEAGNGAFMFPDVYEEGVTEGESSAVGIVITDDTPFNIEGNLFLFISYLVSIISCFLGLLKSIWNNTIFCILGEAQAALEKVLGELTEGSLKKEEPLSKDQRLGKIGRTLVKSAELVSILIFLL